MTNIEINTLNDTLTVTSTALHHKLIIRNLPNDCVVDEYEVATVEFINGYNGQSYQFSLWCDDDFEQNSAEEFSCHVWLNSPVQIKSLEEIDAEALKMCLDESEFDLSLEDLVKNSIEIRQKIKAYHTEGTPFTIEVPLHNQGFSLQSILIDEVLVKLTVQAFERTLTNEGVQELALLITDSDDFSYMQYLINPLFKVINNSNIENSMIYKIKQAFAISDNDFLNLLSDNSVLELA